MLFKPKAQSPASPVEIEIFRPGKHRGMNGKEFTFSRQDVASVASAFDVETSPVPVVIGHPKHDAPAYAWADAVFMEGDILKARLKDVDPGLTELVNTGRYKRISSAFYPPESEQNPTPGQYYLRHIGFLGAAAPAVKGLKPVEFASEADQWIAFGEVDADALVKEYETRMRIMRSEQQIENLIDEGKVLPYARDGLLCFIGGLDDQDMVAFSENEGEEQTQAEWFLQYLKEQPNVVPLGTTNLESDPENDTSTAQFAAPLGHAVDKGGLKTHKKAMTIMREKNVSFEDALGMVDDN